MLTCSVLNQKGGVGKTTVTLGLAAASAAKGLSVLVADIDPQNNAGACLHPHIPASTMDDVINADTAGAITGAAAPSGWPGVDVVPSELALARREADNAVNILFRVRKALRDVDSYDLVLFDCPPSVGTLTVNALVASDRALVVTEPAKASIEGVLESQNTLSLVADPDMNPALQLAGLVVNRRDRTREHIFREGEIVDTFPDHMWWPVIPKRAVVDAAYGACQPVSAYDTEPGREIAWCYDQLAEQLLKEV